MKRRVLNLLTALSLLLCVAVAVLWVRSLFYFDSYNYRYAATSRFLFVGSAWGGLQVATCSGADADDVMTGRTGYTALRLARPSSGWQVFTGFGTDYRRDVLGFRFACGDLGRLVPKPMPFWSTRIPYWFPLILSGLPPLARVRRILRRGLARRRQELGSCPACGYDLTGNVSGVCPECGKANA